MSCSLLMRDSDYNYVRNEDNNKYKGSSGWYLIPCSSCKIKEGPNDAGVDKGCSQAQLPEGPGEFKGAVFTIENTIPVWLEDNTVWRSPNEDFMRETKKGKWLAFYMRPPPSRQSASTPTTAPAPWDHRRVDTIFFRWRAAPTNRLTCPRLASLGRFGHAGVPTPQTARPAQVRRDDRGADQLKELRLGRRRLILEVQVRSGLATRGRSASDPGTLLVPFARYIRLSANSHSMRRDRFKSAETIELQIGLKNYEAEPALDLTKLGSAVDRGRRASAVPRPRRCRRQAVVPGTVLSPQPLLNPSINRASCQLRRSLCVNPVRWQRRLKHTTDIGRSWNDATTPTDPNIFRTPVLVFHLKNADWIICVWQDRAKIFDNIVGFSEYLTSSHKCTVLDWTTDSVFLHLTMLNTPKLEWGNVMKADSNGAYHSVSQDFVSCNGDDFVDFEKLVVLEGIAVVNRALRPARHAMYSSPSIVGPMMAVGNVGEKLAPYVDSDPFLSRDGDFAWEKSPTDRVNYFLNEGMKRNERVFVTNDKMRVESIVTVTGDASRKFVLFGHYAHTR
ncbi:hypothetical protein AURDEDRAFT_131894 [Auricularia subglabra TFB-10046 SS5]|uniref:Sortilin N-terminal domain-containing protein n=1 Tax=Auricularia subglabra (strain TFB-10046 / SS5) TaxID=717982 RepID=J0L9H9_AURST|nr:hypothetical protein AURDEDRAFT_131894 [Auricularia subglabra TFB-10046 SS5]